ATYDRRLGFGAKYPDIVGSDLDKAAQHGIAWQAEYIIHFVDLAPRHHLRTAIVTIATDGETRGRPMAADATHQTTQMTADFVSRWCLAGPQQHRHRPRGGGLVDVDRQEAAFVIMRVEQRKLLMAVHDIDGVVDVQCHGDRR